MKRWRITYIDGTSELTDERVDKIRQGEDVIQAFSTRTYGPDELIASYPLVNLRKWESVT